MSETVHTIWIDSPLPPLQAMCLRSWLHHGFEVVLFAYGETEGVPEGVEVRDARDVMVGPIYRYQDPKHLGHPAMHANIFRYLYLFEHGGAWIDADTLCLRRFALEKEIIVSSEHVKNGDPHPNLALTKMPSGSEVMRRCMEEARKRLANPKWGGFGPKLLKPIVEERNVEVEPPERFCPLPWWEADRLDKPWQTQEELAHTLEREIKHIQPGMFVDLGADGDLTGFNPQRPSSELHGQSDAIHLWSAILNQHNFDLSACSPDSLAGQWREKYA